MQQKWPNKSSCAIFVSCNSRTVALRESISFSSRLMRKYTADSFALVLDVVTWYETFRKVSKNKDRSSFLDISGVLIVKCIQSPTPLLFALLPIGICATTCALGYFWLIL